MMKPTKQNSKRESNSKIELAFIRLLVAVLKTALLIVATMATAQAEPRQHTQAVGLGRQARELSSEQKREVKWDELG